MGNVRTSTFKAICAMLLFRKAHSSNVWEYAPIAKTLAELSMDAITRESIKRKLDIAYMILKEKTACTKMQPLCILEGQHADVGSGYNNDQVCATFVEYNIAPEQKEKLQEALSKVQFFFSLQENGSTDAGNVEMELFLVLFFDLYSTNGTVHVRNSYFTLMHLHSGTAQVFLHPSREQWKI